MANWVGCEGHWHPCLGFAEDKIGRTKTSRSFAMKCNLLVGSTNALKISSVAARDVNLAYMPVLCT